MKNEMLDAGYLWDGVTWTSPFSGKVTSFQPAREEFMVVQQLKPEWLERDSAQKLGRMKHNLVMLRMAARRVIQNWETGDLADAVRRLENTLNKVDNEMVQEQAGDRPDGDSGG